MSADLYKRFVVATNVTLKDGCVKMADGDVVGIRRYEHRRIVTRPLCKDQPTDSSESSTMSRL